MEDFSNPFQVPSVGVDVENLWLTGGPLDGSQARAVQPVGELIQFPWDGPVEPGSRKVERKHTDGTLGVYAEQWAMYEETPYKHDGLRVYRWVPAIPAEDPADGEYA